MAEQTAVSEPPADEINRILADIAEKSRIIVEEFAARQSHADPVAPSLNPTSVSNAFMEWSKGVMANPAELMQAQFNLWQDYMRLWQGTTQRLLGGEVEPVILPDRGDRRFKDPAWEENPLFSFIKQSYLLTSRYMMDAASHKDGLAPKTQQKVEFYTRQFVDALAPTNFLMTNPEVLKATVDTRGENLLKGLRNMLEDLERGHGRLSIRMTDADAFELGRNIATTPGKVVYQNELLQLIQYEPTTETVFKRPLLIIPPWINKFYILDLQNKNSFIKFCVDQGFTTFVISWVNPDERLANKNFEDYMLEGPLEVLGIMEKITGERDANVIGYCLGGTLLASSLAYMAKGGDRRIKAATFFASMVDFREPGELGVFIDEEQLSTLEESMRRQGYLDGAEMAATFNMLRANDLIWSFVVNNYLLGKDPFPFDLLYWNADSTRMPAAMHSFYLRRFYHENKLVEPGGVTLNGVPIDLREIKVPCYWVSTREDHIAPWKSTYAATQIYGGAKRFVLAGSGHIAGIINPPVANKYGYWLNDQLPVDPDAWLAAAEQHPGSWWEDWAAWNAEKSEGRMPARRPGDGDMPILEDAPGNYVKVKVS